MSKSITVTQAAQTVVPLPQQEEKACALPPPGTRRDVRGSEPAVSPQRTALADQQSDADTLVHVLHRHATERPDHRAFVFVRDDESDNVVMTYAHLDEQARCVAAHLQQMGLAGERVLLAFPPGLDFITGYFGCLYAGCAAVPVALPQKRTLDRFGNIAADAEARLVLSTPSAIAQFHAMTRRLDRRRSALPIPWLAVDELASMLAARGPSRQARGRAS